MSGVTGPAVSGTCPGRDEGVEDLHGALRHELVLRGGPGCRPACRGARLRGSCGGAPRRPGCCRPRAARNRHVYDVRHFIPVLERKPGALRNGAPFRAEHLPPAVAEVKARLEAREDGGREMVRILLEARDRGLELVAAACAEALEAGACSADLVLNILSRRCDPGPAAPVATPAGLELSAEPVADCARYDDLLGRQE